MATEELSSTSTTKKSNHRPCCIFGSITGIFAVVAVVLYFAFRKNVFTDGNYVYKVMFDGGSTGTRMHVFQFHLFDSDLILTNATTMKVEPGLSSYAATPEKAAENIKKLVQHAERLVPEDQRESTTISLKATAGLRILNESQQVPLLDVVRDVFSNSSFKTNNHSVEIMDGAHEGVYSWVSMAFLLRDVKDSNIASLDMGGGSTQVTLKPSDQETLKEEADILTVKTPNGKVNLYTKSYLRGGIMYARSEILKKNQVRQNGSQIYVESPCILSDVVDEKWTYFDNVYHAKSNPKDETSFDKCYKLAKDYVKEELQLFSPPEISGKELYLMSYFYDHAVITGLIKPSEKFKELTVGSYSERASAECSLPTEHSAKYPFLCTDLTYLYTILKDGYGLSDNTTLMVLNSYLGYDVSWALGAALEELQ